MTKLRREQIEARLREMTCVRASAPISNGCRLLGWGANEDGTMTFWLAGPNLSLQEGPTLRNDIDPADFEQLQVMLLD